MKLVAYLRVSTEVQARDGLGLELQERAIRAWCKRNDHRLAAMFTDAGISGSNGVEGREQLARALAAVADRQGDGIVTYNLDRLARALTVQEGILGQVWAAGGQVFTVEDGKVPEDDPADPYRTAMRQVRGVFSQLERAVIRSRMESGRRLKAETGGYAGYGAPPYGWAPAEGILKEVPAEQAVLARMRALRAGGASLRQIVEELSAAGLMPRPRKNQAGAWTPETVRRALSPELRLQQAAHRRRTGPPRDQS